MRSLSPQPRYRIYTRPTTYFTVFKEMLTGKIRNGDSCNILERDICSRFGIAHAMCMPQARVGIYYAIKAMLEPGKKLIMSPYTIADVVNMVILAGARPVFADVERKTCNIDPASIERLIDKDTGAVFITHLHGLACDMGRIVDLCKRSGVPLIEDAAQAFGTKYGGRMVGTFGDAGIYSFGMYKNLTAFYGGMTVTPHDSVAKYIQNERGGHAQMDTLAYIKKATSGLMTDVATSPPLFQAIVHRIFRFGYLHDVECINKRVETELDVGRKKQMPEHYLRRMTPMQARILLTGLDKVERENSIRIRYAHIYEEGLCDIPELILPPCREDGSHIYTYYPIQFDERKKLIRWMMQNHRDVTRQHLKNCADLSSFEDFYSDCPNARQTAEANILLPTYPRYGEEEVRRNVNCIRTFFGK